MVLALVPWEQSVTPEVFGLFPLDNSKSPKESDLFSLDEKCMEIGIFARKRVCSKNIFTFFHV